MSFYAKTIRTAAKKHRCGETGTPINIGDPYAIYTGVSDGDLYSCKMHARLAGLFDRLNDESWKSDGEGLQFGSLSEAVFDSLPHFPNQQRIGDAELFASCYVNGAPNWMLDSIAEAKRNLAPAKAEDAP